MARKKETKPRVIIDKPKKACSKCGKDKVIDANFYQSKSNMFDGRVPICKSCIKSLVDYDDMQSIYNLFQQMDIMFDIDYWKSSLASKTDTFARYMTMVNSMHQLEGKTWKDSVFERSNDSVSNECNINKAKEVFEVTEQLKEKWGEGYSSDQYRLFEKKYNRLIRNYGEKTELHTEGLLTYVRFRVQEEVATAESRIKDAKEWATLASKAAQDAKINVSQLSKSDISGGIDVLSQLFEATESEASLIPLLPKMLEQPYDDADMIIWANINYYRQLEDKPRIDYREIWDFYDEMIGEHLDTQGYSRDYIEEYKRKRNNVFRDLGEVYIEPLYEEKEDD